MQLFPEARPPPALVSPCGPHSVLCKHLSRGWAGAPPPSARGWGPASPGLTHPQGWRVFRFRCPLFGALSLPGPGYLHRTAPWHPLGKEAHSGEGGGTRVTREARTARGSHREGLGTPGTQATEEQVPEAPAPGAGSQGAGGCLLTPRTPACSTDPQGQVSAALPVSRHPTQHRTKPQSPERPEPVSVLWELRGQRSGLGPGVL